MQHKVTAPKGESDAILRENAREARYNRLACNLWEESGTWPDASKAFFRGAMRLIHVGAGERLAILEWPDGMATFERNLMGDKLQRMAALRGGAR